MLKKITKFLIIMLLAILLLTPTVMATNVQTQSRINTERYPTNFSTMNTTLSASNNKYSVGNVQTIYNFTGGLESSGVYGALFCLNKGLIFNGGTEFYVFETGSIANLRLNHGINGDNGMLLSFIIGDMKRNGRSSY